MRRTLLSARMISAGRVPVFQFTTDFAVIEGGGGVNECNRLISLVSEP